MLLSQEYSKDVHRTNSYNIHTVERRYDVWNVNKSIYGLGPQAGVAGTGDGASDVRVGDVPLPKAHSSGRPQPWGVVHIIYSLLGHPRQRLVTVSKL